MSASRLVRALVSFELVRRIKMISTWVYAVILFAAGFFMMLSAGGAFSSVTVVTSNERVMANSPQSLFNTIGVVGLFGVFTVAAIFGQAAHQDFQHDTWMLIFTKNVKKTPYLLGRFLGALVFACVLFLAIGVGQLLGSLAVHFIHPEALGRTSPAAYLWPYVVQVWPMLFFVGAMFFSLAAITRRMAPVYVGAVVLVLGYLLTTTLVRDVENMTLAGILDPFGFMAFSLVTRYWTPAEQNAQLVPLVSLFGVNRVLWSAVGAVLLGLATHRFRTTVDEHRGRAAGSEERSDDATPFPTTVAVSTTTGWARASLGLMRIYFREIVRSGVYWALVVSAVFFGTVFVLVTKDLFGTATLPVTYQALEMTAAAVRLFGLIMVTFYAGELVWRERDVGAQDIFDATRAPTWVGYAAKLGALLLVALSVEGVSAVVALVSQIARGYFAIDWSLYLTELVVIDFTGLALASVLAFFVHVVIDHKYIGHAAMVLYYVSRIALAAIGVEEPLVRYASEPSTKYSDMNGYGHLLEAFFWFRAYWSGLAIVLVVAGYALSVRGRERRLRARIAAGRRRLGLLAKTVAAAGALVFVGSGAYIFHSTHVLNRYETAKDVERQRAEYEKKYKSVASTPQPSIVGAEVRMDIYPEERRLVAKGTYRLANKGGEPISRVMVNLDDDLLVHELRIGDTRATEIDDRLGVRFFTLPSPLGPGKEADLVYDLELRPKGFAHGAPKTRVVHNGTFVNNGVLPVIGYMPNLELESDRDRKSYGLPPKERMAPRDDPNERMHNYIRRDSDFIRFAATVSTSGDQIAVAPGYLEGAWWEGNRRVFRYVMDQPILNFFSVLSARYAVRRDEWNGVKLEIFHHPAHTQNLERMMQGMKDTLAYATEAFGPYQHRQARILEFPRYQMFAQAFPNTIPYSEAIGFIARVRESEPDDVDYPYYVTAHEIAHQWWAHQVVGANVRGATMTSESMAQYTALMVMQRQYGKERMRRFLKFELDSYLRGRALERKKELPLAHNENQQYVHYNKGSVAMYALADYIGEDRVNRALRKVVEKWKFQGPPYPTAKDLVDAFREETQPEYQYLIDDLFETITLYDNRTLEASVVKNAGGTWDVRLKVLANKLRSDEAGKQTELDFEDWIDVGALDGAGTAIHVEKVRIKNGESEVRFTVKERPAKVGIDPLNKLIDRDSNDNVKAPSAS